MTCQAQPRIRLKPIEYAQAHCVNHPGRKAESTVIIRYQTGSEDAASLCHECSLQTYSVLYPKWARRTQVTIP